MQLLKSVVIGLGGLIFLGLGLLAYGFIQKASNPDWRLFSSAPAPATDAPKAKPFGTLKLGLPEGCVITGVRPEGGLVYLSIGSGGGNVTGGPCNRVIVVDTSRGRGRILGTIMPGP